MTAVTYSERCQRKIYGLESAFVVDNLDPDSLGRIQVQFPCMDDHHVTDWVRVAQMYAGSGYGAFMMPEVGDEVLVAFLQGDINQPVIVGSMYNGVNTPHTFRTNSQDQKAIRTKSGHLICLDDSTDHEKISIVDKSENHRVVISTSDESIVIESKGGKLVLNANEIEINAKTSLKIDCGQMDANGGSSMKLKAGTIELN